jgi:hypothetical protein
MQAIVSLEDAKLSVSLSEADQAAIRVGI